MVNEKEILEKQIQEQESRDPLKHIEKLEEQQKLDELRFQERERELLIKIAKQTEESKSSRKLAQQAEQKAKVAEYKYLNSIVRAPRLSARYSTKPLFADIILTLDF